jgi:hypothetical protein
MRVRELALVAALAGCMTNPDPRSPSIQTMERNGFGGYVVLQTPDGYVQGELISVEPGVVRVRALSTHTLSAVPIGRITKAQVYTYEANGYFGAWGAVGALTTLSHGYFLVFTAPIWLISGGIATAVETHHVKLEWPGDSWREIAAWARFPQGMPPGLDPRALEAPLPPPPPPPPVIAPPPGPSPDEIRIQQRQQAWELTKQASDAARHGDCAFVLSAAEKVKALDPTFYDAPFATDVAIRACLEPATER